jgi:transcriptional regulator with XRE-family HTH domain
MTMVGIRKENLIRGLAALQGRTLAELARRAGVHRSVFYRIVRGERTSARVNRYLARELGLTAAGLRSTVRTPRRVRRPYASTGMPAEERSRRHDRKSGRGAHGPDLRQGRAAGAPGGADDGGSVY